MSVHADAAKLVLQAYADGEVDVLDQLHAPDYIEHSPLPGQAAGPAGLRERAMIYGVAATGRRVQAAGIWVFRFVDGLIAESWSSMELQELLATMTEPRDTCDYSTYSGYANELQTNLA
jgi:predicted SnoaL-like aldol condensation-catalyzing enzyme